MRPLDGFRVVDLTRVLSGPYCTMQLGDLGAEVIKVERPGEGDDTRAFAPAIPGRSGGLFPLRQPQQEEHHARHEDRAGQGSALAPDRCVRCAGRELSPRRHGSPRSRLRSRKGAASHHGLLLDLGLRRHRPAEGPSGLRRHCAGRSRHHGHHGPARRAAAQGRRGDGRSRLRSERVASHLGCALRAPSRPVSANTCASPCTRPSPRC